MKYKVEMPKDWKSTFTVEQLDEIKRVRTSVDEDLPNTLKMFAEIMAGGEKILSVSFEWCRDQGSFYNHNVDIWCEMWCTDGDFTVHHIGAVFSKINEIGAITRDEAVYHYGTFNNNQK